MRLIDADVLQKALANMWYESQISVTGISVSELIDEQPTIEAVEVVRCKDCIHHDDFIIGEEGSLLCWKDGTDRVVSAMGYCECGERRSDG